MIASAVAADPSADERLVELAGTMSLAELREECARVRAAADPDPAARNARLHRARRLRRFTDPEGAWQLLARGTPQAGAAFNAVLDPLIDQVFQAARRAGRAEALEAYAFDALMALADLAAGEQPCLRGPTPSQAPEGGGGPVSPTPGRAAATGPQVTARTTPSSPADGTAASAPQPSHGHTDAPADASNPLPDGTSPGVVPGTPSPAGPPSSDNRQDPASLSRRLDGLPWWAAAQGLLLDPGSDHEGGDGGCARALSRDQPLSRPGHTPPAGPGGGAGPGQEAAADSDRRPWWRLAHLLGPDPLPTPGWAPPDRRAGAGSADLRATPEDTLGPEQPRPGDRSVRRQQSVPDDPVVSVDPSVPPDPLAPECSSAPPAPWADAARSARPGIVSPAGGRRNPRHLALLRVDVTALRHGSLQPGETCEIAGVGPVPVDVARELLGDAVLKLVITRGVDVLNVTHLGRGPTAAQRVALAWQSPGCSVIGCPRRRVEIDHREDWARSRHTRLDELDSLCGHHHDLKTRLGWALVMGTGRRAFVPPSDRRHPRYGVAVESGGGSTQAVRR